MKVHQYFGREDNMKDIPLMSSPSMPSNTKIGIEVEVENFSMRNYREKYNNHKGYGLWTQKDDGSLRNGVEFITVMPLAGKGLENAIRHFSFIQKAGFRTSSRTSLHIHVDVRDLEFHQVENFIEWALYWEEYMFHRWGRSRMRNIFCSRLGKMTKINQTMSLNRQTGEMDKYTSININSIRNHGSIEFRMFEVPKSTVELHRIVRFLQKMRDLAVEGKSVLECWSELDQNIGAKERHSGVCAVISYQGV